MSDNTKKIEIKEVDGKTVKAKDGTEYKIWVKKTTVNFPDKKNGTKSNEDVEIEYKKADADDKTDREKLSVKVTNETGYFLPDVKLPKELKSGLELKETVSLPVKGFEWGFWIGGIILLLLVAAGLWWWISSSRKEEKEEEAGL